MLDPPACPRCEALAHGAPDSLGVWCCGGCGGEFRPPLRMPIRRAGVSENTQGDQRSWLLAVVIAAGVGGAMALGDARAPQAAGSEGASGLPLGSIAPSLPAPTVLGALDLDVLGRDALELGPLASLDYEIETQQIHGGELFATGTLLNSHAEDLTQVGMHLVVRDAQGGSLGRHEVSVACPEMFAGELCPWSLEIELEAGASQFEFSARGLRSAGIAGFERTRAHSVQDVAAGTQDELELRYDAQARAVVVELEREHADTLLGAWVSVSAFDELGRVLGVRRAEAEEVLHAGRGRVRISGVRDDDAVARYELRLGAALFRAEGLAAPASLPTPAPIELPPLAPLRAAEKRPDPG